MDGGLTLGRVDGRAEGVPGRVDGRAEGVLGREGRVLGLDNPPIDGRLEGRLTEGRLAEDLEPLENDGRELGLDDLGFDTLGRDGLDREALCLDPPERPIDGRDPPEGRETLLPPPPPRPPRPRWASDVSGANMQIKVVSAMRPVANRIFLFMIGHLSEIQEVNSISPGRLGRLANDGGLEIGLNALAEDTVEAFHEEPVFAGRLDENRGRSGRSVG